MATPSVSSLFIGFLAAWLALLQPGAAPPDTEVVLLSFSVEGRRVTLGAPLNISNNAGYDNQPAFTPDGAAVLFTSVRGGGTQSDIYRHDVASGRLTQVTNTPEREYSPTVMPGGTGISVVRVEADQAQRLWQFTMDGQNPQLVLANIKPVGYHAWADNRTLALFVLGEPPTLQVASLDTGASAVVERGIGRSLQRVPGSTRISFVVRETTAGAPPVLWIREIDLHTRQVTPLIRAVRGATEADLAWTPDGLLLMAHADTLYGWRRGEADWSELADLGALGLAGVTRIAVSPKGDRIALVRAGS
jgi:hypothetical protein